MTCHYQLQRLEAKRKSHKSTSESKIRLVWALGTRREGEFQEGSWTTLIWHYIWKGVTWQAAHLFFNLKIPGIKWYSLKTEIKEVPTTIKIQKEMLIIKQSSLRPWSGEEYTLTAGFLRQCEEVRCRQCKAHGLWSSGTGFRSLLRSLNQWQITL